MTEREELDGPLHNRTEQFVADVSETYGIDPEIVAVGFAWAWDWYTALQEAIDRGETLSKELLAQTQKSAEDALPIPRDKTEGRPTFRVRYAAERVLLTLLDNDPDILALIDGKGHAIVPNFARIDEVLMTLLDSYSRKLYPYNLDSTRVPQDPRHMPRRPEFTKLIEERSEEDCIKLANFWFIDCYYMRGVNDSNDMTINLATLYEDHPEIFDPHHAMTMNPADIEKLILEYHMPVQHAQISKFWVENARRMVERYDGDPRKIFENFGSYDELVDRVRNDGKGGGFQGFQKKMTSMIGYFMMINDLIPYQNIPLPVDFHVMRVSISTEMITFPDIVEPRQIDFDRVTDVLREIYYDFADHHDISQLDLCDVVWLYSGAACSVSPTNSQSIKGERKARETVFAPALESAESATSKQVDAYNASCGHCRLTALCAQNVPSGEYYIAGRVVYPNPKIHLRDAVQADLHDPATLIAAQQGKNGNGKVHEIERRRHGREITAGRRDGLIRGLARPALFPLEPEEGIGIRDDMIHTDHMVGNSLSGKRFAVTLEEVERALGHVPTREELENLWPYLNSTDTLF